MSLNDTTTPKKRKSPIPTLREWEKLNLRQYALSTLKSIIKPQYDISALQDKLDSLETEIKQKKRKETVFIKKGYQSVLFFLKNPKLIPVMKQEMELRQQVRQNNGDIIHHDFKDSNLSQHCRFQATAIFDRDDSSCRDCTYSYNYFRVRCNYAETMGRACLIAEETISLYHKLTNPQPTPQETCITRAELPLPQIRNHWKKYTRPSEDEVNHLLNNHCDDYVEDEHVAEEPQKITTSKLKQMEFDFNQKQRQ